MDLLDNNLLIYALRPDTSQHAASKLWLEEALNAGRPIRLFPTVEAGFLRVVTHPGIFAPPTPQAEAAEFLRIVASCPSVASCPWTAASRDRWLALCASLDLRGNDCNDAMLAAVAIERGLRLVTFDRGFRRFPGLALLVLEG